MRRRAPRAGRGGAAAGHAVRLGRRGAETRHGHGARVSGRARRAAPRAAARARPGGLLLPPRLQGGRRQGERLQLEAAPDLLPGHLSLDGGTQPQGDGDELADRAATGVDAVQPRLAGQHDVVLRVAGQCAGPGPAGDRADLAGADLERRRLRAAREAQPQRLAQVQGDEDPAAGQPLRRRRVREVLDPPYRELAEPRRQRVRAVLGQPQRPDEPDPRSAAPHQGVPVDPHGSRGHRSPSRRPVDPRRYHGVRPAGGSRRAGGPYGVVQREVPSGGREGVSEPGGDRRTERRHA